MNRVVVPAALAVLILLGSAAGIWVALLRGVATAMTAQSRLASETLDANVPFTPALARALVQQGLHVVLVDHNLGIVIDATASGAIVRPGPGDGGQLPGAPPGAPPPPPGAPPPQGARPSAFAESFVRLVPLRVMRGDRSIDITPDLSVRPRASLHVRVATAARWRPASPNALRLPNAISASWRKPDTNCVRR